MKLLVLCVVNLMCTGILFAQSERDKKAYAAEATKIQSAVWGNPAAEFKATTVPAALSKESAVIIAKSFSLSRASNGKIKFERDNDIKTHATKFSIFHERVKINDKLSLENYSTLEYQKKLDKTTRFGFSKLRNENNTFIGAKVVKPNGKEIIANTDEEVMVKNEAKDQQRKLAISELQVGDILDYYICKEDIVDKEIGNLYADNDNLFLLTEEYPVLYYSLDFQFNKKIKTKTIYANGAQHFAESTNNEGDRLFSLVLRDIPKFQSQVWTSPLRQYPYVEIGSAYDDDLDNIIKKNHFDGQSAMLDARKYVFEHDFNEMLYPYSELENKFKAQYNDKKALKNAPPDSSMKVLYAEWKYNTFCFYGDNLDEFAKMKYRDANSRYNTIIMAELLSDLKIDFDVLMVAPRTGNTLGNVFNLGDFDAAIRINSEKPLYMFFDDMSQHFNEIPDRFQGEKVIVLHPKRKGAREYTFTESEDTLPVSSADVNNIDERLNVSMADAAMQKLKIERIVRQKGALRHDDQKNLAPLADIDVELTAAANGMDIDKRFKSMSGSKKYAVTLRSLFEKEKEDNSKNFKEEIKAKFDQEPQQVGNCKIVNLAIDNSKPVFEYNENFVLTNLVKKAGDNYLIDVGKLTGGFFKVTEKDRKRNVDVYMPCARSFKYTIAIAIPPGYAPKGMEELSVKKSNKTGSFSASASFNGNTLTIIVNRVYANNFEHTTDWPALIDILDTASGFDSQKILLEKKG